MSRALEGEQLPQLVVGHGPRSVPPLQVVEAASGLCRLVWLVDEDLADNASALRLLRRIGTVVNTAGLSPGEVASVLVGYSPRGVVAYRDEDIVPLSLIAQELGLDYHPPDVARRLVDKLVQRAALRSGGLSTPGFWELPSDRADVEALGAVVEFPAVLKPRSGSGGQYTVPVTSADDLVRAVSTLPSQAGGATGMYLEQYLPSAPSHRGERFADYLSVESLVSHGRISHFAITGRFPLAEPFRETGFFIPAEISPTRRTAVLEVATGALAALGVSTGDFHTEIKLTPAGPRVLEVNGRLGGGVPEMLFEASGESLMRLSMRVALGEDVAVDAPLACSKVGWRFLFQAPASARRVISVEGLDRLAAMPGVNSVFLNRGPGTSIDPWDGTRHYIYSVYGVSDDYERLLEIDRFLHKEVTIVYG